VQPTATKAAAPEACAVRTSAPTWPGSSRPTAPSNKGFGSLADALLGKHGLGKVIGFHCTIAGFTPLHFGHEGFAVICQLAQFHSASYPVPVRRLAVSFHASHRRSPAVPPLRFPSVPLARSGKNFHLQVSPHARRTIRGGAAYAAAPLFRSSAAIPTALGAKSCAPSAGKGQDTAGLYCKASALLSSGKNTRWSGLMRHWPADSGM
jgi:hypothetical protein